jgi:hypothetical protein
MGMGVSEVEAAGVRRGGEFSGVGNCACNPGSLEV